MQHETGSAAWSAATPYGARKFSRAACRTHAAGHPHRFVSDLMPEPTAPLTERDPLVPAADDAADPAPPPAFNRAPDALRGPAPADAERDPARALRDPIPPPRTPPSFGTGFRGFDPEPEQTGGTVGEELLGRAAAWIRANREAALLGSFAVGVVLGVLLRR